MIMPTAITITGDNCTGWMEHARVRPYIQFYERALKSITASNYEFVALVHPVASMDIANSETMVADARDEIQHYSTFGSEWDGYSAKPFEQDTIMKADSLLVILLQHLSAERIVPSEITPGPASDGSIDIELRIDQRTMILTVSKDLDELGYYMSDPKNSKMEETSIDWKTLGAHVSRFIGQNTL